MTTENAYFYPGARPFEDTDIDRKLFFGRDREKEDLLQKVLARKLVVLFAKSGLGKTSLINAGISEPLREKGFLPLKVRFNREGINPVQTVFESIRDRVEQIEMGWEAGEEYTLWHYFKTAAFWSEGDSLMTPVLILDQFEDFFAFHEPEARSEFILQLADLVNGTIPSALRQAVREGEPFPYSENPPEVKVLISIRENYLDLLEELSVELPDILCSRFRLSELTRDQARDAISKPPKVRDEQIGTAGFSYSDDALNSMLDYLSKVKEKDREIRRDEVESFQLQLLCRHIEWNIRARAREVPEADGFVVNKEYLGGEAGMQKMLQNFYEEGLAGLKTLLRKRRVRRLCEHGLISTSDHRVSLKVDEIERKYKVSPSLLAQLVESRLLRGENRVGSVYYELSHDTLVTLILLSRCKRRAKIRKYTILFLLPVLITAAIIAIGSYKKALELRLEEAYDHIDAGNSLAKKGDYGGAIESYKKALELKPDYAAAHNNMGNVLYNIDDYDRAIGSYKKALELKPDYAAAHNNLGLALYKEGDYGGAIESYKKALELKPYYTEAHNNMGVVLYHKGDYDGAITCYKKALELKPDYAAAHNNLGLALYKKGDYYGAIEGYKKALELKPDDADARNNMGNSLADKGDFNGAIACYKKVLEINPENISAKMNLAEIYLTTEQLEKALELVKEVLKEKKKHIYRILAMKSISISVLFLQGQQPAAIEELEKLISYYREFPEDYNRGWNYNITRSFIRRTKKLSEQNRVLLLAMIDLLEAPKEERGEKLKTLETMLLQRK